MLVLCAQVRVGAEALRVLLRRELDACRPQRRVLGESGQRPLLPARHLARRDARRVGLDLLGREGFDVAGRAGLAAAVFVGHGAVGVGLVGGAGVRRAARGCGRRVHGGKRCRVGRVVVEGHVQIGVERRLGRPRARIAGALLGERRAVERAGEGLPFGV